MVVAMVCLMLSVLLLGSLLKLAVMQRQQFRHQQHRLQAYWLAESAVERAASRLAENRDYAGELWEIGSDELGGRHAAHVRIQVAEPERGTSERTVTAIATYPAGEAQFATQTKRVTVPVNQQP